MWIQVAHKQGLIGGVGIALGALLSGCNSFDPPPNTDPHLEIPTDERPAVTSAARPRPVTGGTLAVLKDGSAAIVADPDRDRVSIVDLNLNQVRKTIELQPGDEPGRIVEDGSQHVHVALRGGGAVVSIDPASGEVLDRRAVCKAPRGIAFDQATSLLHVACAEGTLVSLQATGGAATRTLTLEPDLRDVVVQGNELWVTRFKSAEVLRVDSAGSISHRVTLPKTTGQLSVPPPKQTNNNVPVDFAGSKDVTVSPGVAWRALANPSGGALLVHQQEVDDDITISEPTQGTSAYGGGGGGTLCDGIVKNAITLVDANGNTTTTPFTSSPLAVDVAMNTNWVAVAQAGTVDDQAPRPFMVFPGSGSGASAAPVGTAAKFGGGAVTMISTASAGGGNCAFPEGFVPVQGPVTAVAFAPNGNLVVQSQEPAQLTVTNPSSGTLATVDLMGESRADTGHELFHRDAGGGIACASCHPEGGEDGHTWHFADSGARRTQSLQVGLSGTAPFHWAGDLADVGAVMSTVFVGRMGGVNQTPERTDTLTKWLFGMQRTPAIRDAGDAAAIRGKALFESPSVGCNSCHAGEKFTNNQTVAIDANREKLQVPSLVDVGYRAPFMHDGCALTLAGRFDPACGGNQHGNVSGLTQDQKSDLVAYLETL
ncbi:MAG TPA: cytochrome-c peroxidase [Polyangiaceae bacterium]|nr:cytochrome-c peroxidase [Polyangiaceae bacterium]